MHGKDCILFLKYSSEISITKFEGFPSKGGFAKATETKMKNTAISNMARDKLKIIFIFSNNLF
jgi:hypothetical protein